MSSKQPFYAARVLAAGVALIAAGGLLLILMLSSLLGSFRYSGTGPPSRVIGFYVVPAADSDTAVRRLRAWHRVAPSSRPRRESDTLEELEESGVRLVVIPDASALSPLALGRLRHYVENGGGLVVAGAIGVVDLDGTWRGFDSMRSLLGVERIEPLDRERSRRARAAVRGPLSAPLLPAEAIELVPEAGVPGVLVPQAEIVWGDAAEEVDEIHALARPARPAAALRRSLGRGRIAWLGFGPVSAAGSIDPEGAMARLVASTLAWAAGDPVIEVVPFQSGSSDATRAEHDTNAQAFAAARRSIGAAAAWVGPGRFRIDVSNRERRRVSARVRIHLDDALAAATIAPTKVFQSVPDIERVSGALEIPVHLEPRDSQAWFVDLQVSPSDA